MLLFRRLYRITALLLWFIITGSMAFPFYFGGWCCIRVISKITRLWGYGITKIINLRVHIHGDISSFKGGLIVSNHSGYLDIITHSSVFPIRFTPKAEISGWPLLGQFLALNRPIWIDRRSKQKSMKTVKRFEETIEHGIPLIIYPEGTSTDGQSGLLPFKSPPFEPVVSKNFPILPIITMYTPPDGYDSVCWHGDKVLMPHVWQILAYPYIDVDLHILPVADAKGKDRKQTAEYIRGMMEEKYWQIMKKETEGSPPQ